MIDIKDGNWFEDPSHFVIVVQLLKSKTTCLGVEEFGNIENCLVFFPVEALEEIGVIRLAKQRNCKHLINHVSHRLEPSLDLLSGLYERCQRITHEKHWEVFVVNPGLLGGVVKYVHKCFFILLICNRQMAVTRYIDAVQLCKESQSLIIV